ncbi:uncharacterized protein [Battus philenor]|uniref:uncharacterized protein n=1 Tax=Battus philenor TaxID=42288 RepID=UPI0035D03014
MSALDKFKRRLVRNIARRMHQVKQPEEEMWRELNQHYVCDCRLLWNHMRALTLKKLKRLLAAEDHSDRITKIARMTFTDWLTFDMVLVHEKIDVIAEDMIVNGKPESSVLIDLFNLVEKYDIENQPVKSLLMSWVDLTKEYNTGGRQCSPMLLQRRWWQLKQLTRSKVYSFWHTYRGNPKLLDKAKLIKPTKLQLKIVERYPHIITKPFDQWSDLILKKKVVQACAFENGGWMIESKSSNNESEADLVLVEPEVETIELAADSDSDNEVTDNDVIKKIEKNVASIETTDVKQNVEMIVKNEPTDEIINVDEENDVFENPGSDQIQIKSDNASLCDKNAQGNTEETDFTMKEELNLPKITSVMGNVTFAESHTEINDVINEHKICNITLDNKGNTVSDEDKKHDDSNVSQNSDVITDINTLPLHLKFIDDGIEFDDGDNEDICEKTINESEDNETKSIDSLAEDDATCNIDTKITMCAVTYTKKLDQMNIFKGKSFNFVKGDHIIECALRESKPILNNIVTEDLNIDQSYDDSNSFEIPRVSYTSWLLQKPKSRKYNPIQLCKNPDFNTRLKRITVGFFTSERNRRLFSACKPVTIDIHKGFERKLVNNTLYLKSSNTPVSKLEKKGDTCESTVSVLPSAIPVQSLIDSSKLSLDEFLPKAIEAKEHGLPKHEDVQVLENYNVSNLSDVEHLNVVNKKLLTAEISPILSNYPPVQLIKVPYKDPAHSANAYSTSIPIDENNSSSLEPQKKRVVSKRIQAPKIRKIVPPWSVFYSQDSTDESLITKDTLNKVLCLLNGVEPSYRGKNKKRYPGSLFKETPEANKKDVEEMNKNDDNPINLEKDVQLDTSTTNLQNEEKKEVTGSSKATTKKRSLKNSYHTFSTQINYCCWAKYRLERINNKAKKKLRHLCPKTECFCCCRDLLKSKSKKVMLTDKYKLNQPTIPLKKPDISGQIDESNVEKHCRSPSAIAITEVETASIDTILNHLNSECSIQSPLTNLVPSSFGAVQFEAEANDAALLPSVCLTNVEITDMSCNQDLENHESNTTDTEPSEVPPKAPLKVYKNSKKTQTTSATQKAIIVNDLNSPVAEVIPLDEDETITKSLPSPSSSLTPLSNNSVQSIIPKGVNLVLLPDNTLSFSIDSGIEIDYESLSKLPEILNSVQKQLSDSAKNVLPRVNQSFITNINDPPKDEQNPLSNDNRDNLLQTHSKDLSLNSGNIHIENCKEDSSELVLDKSHNAARLTDNLNPNDKVCKSDKLHTLNKTKTDAEMTNIQTDTISGEANSCSATVSLKRKTILSDLMTLSGISPEDIYNNAEGPIPSESLSKDNTEMNTQVLCSESSDSMYNPSTVESVGNVKKYKKLTVNKIVKKIIISIRRKAKVNGSLNSNTVIDLTDDFENPENVEQNETKSTSVQSPIKQPSLTDGEDKKSKNLGKHSKSSPLLKSALETSTNTKSIRSKVEQAKRLTIFQQYRQPRRKPCILRRSQIKQMSLKKQHRDCASNSSDDEPLAKKCKRIRDEGTVTSFASSINSERIVAIPNYDISVEFEKEETDTLKKTDIDSNSDGEGNCILGV